MRALVVDDEDRLTDALKRGLEAEGFAVDVAATGTDGLWLATEQSYDVIVLDIMLPGINGLKVCKALRDKRIWTPILMLTAKDGELDETEALDTGADDFLSKPFSYPVLLARIRALLRRRAPGTIEVNGVRMDLGARLVTVDGVEITLANKEFELLRVLIQRAGQVVTRDEILTEVWNGPELKTSKTLDMHMSWLRRKLGEDGARSTEQRIATVRGVGFRFNAD